MPALDMIELLGDLTPSAFRPITMEDVRLCAGEGKLSADTVLQACNAIIARRYADFLIAERYADFLINHPE